MARYQVGLQTEAKIIDATRSLLAEGGLEAATLKAICDRAEVRSGSFYNLFDSKEEAIIRVVRESIDAVDPDPGGGVPTPSTTSWMPTSGSSRRTRNSPGST